MAANSLSEEYGDPVPDTLSTCWVLFQQMVDRYPSDLVLVSMHQPSNLYNIPNVDLDNDIYKQQPYLRWDYKSFGVSIDRFAAGLQRHGARKGMPLITFVPNGAERMISAFTANKLGCPFTAINTRNLVNLEETAHMINICKLNATADGLIFVAQDPGIAEQIDAMPSADGAVKILVNGITAAKGWVNFENVMKDDESKDEIQTDNGIHEPNDEILFFSSGTTALPKGCRWAHPQLATVLAGRETLPGAGRGDKWCCVLPNNHVYAQAMTIISICNGTAVVFPGQAFDPKLMFAALLQEKCTHVSLVPTMVVALIALKQATGQELPHLKSAMLGGAVVSPQVLDQCVNELGAQEVENTYGMTDGVYFTLGSQKDINAYIDGDEVAAGRAIPGTALKICRSGETIAVPRNTLGELHFNGGPSCDGYVGQKTDAWYTDNGTPARRWFRTGDQARMDEQGRIFIVGRYKDVVIRGGKNLACTAMEACLGKNPDLVPYNVQIVAAPDPIAGEVPVAVTETVVSKEHAISIQETLRLAMGTEYVPDEVVSAEELGLKSFPRTLMGKVQKVSLAKLVEDLRAKRDITTNGDDSKFAMSIREIWARSVGIPIDRLTDDALLTDFADSITMMRVRDRIKRETSRNLSIVEVAEAGTLGNLIEILRSRATQNVEEAPAPVTRRQGPPEADDMVHLVEEPELLEPTKQLVTKAIGAFGFDWNDVQDVMPAYDFMAVIATTHIIDSWNFKFAILPSAGDKEQVRRAIETFLRVNPILPSFFVWDDEALRSDLALHVTLQSSQKLFDTVIEDAGVIKTKDEFQNLAFTYPRPEHSRFPGPLVRFLLYEIEETRSCGFVVNMNHAIMDASCAQIFLDDLEHALEPTRIRNQTLKAHPDYKLWADSYFSLRTSPEAKRAVKWHATRLKELHKHRPALWPAIPTFVPYDDAAVSGDDGIKYTFEAPGIRTFRSEHRNITAPIFLKGALALVNVHITEHTHALFANLEAARTTYPFITKSMVESGKYEATEVVGPTLQAVLNLIQIESQETVASFLQRMQEDQTNLTKYASAPWRELTSALGDTDHLLPRVLQTQLYNWVPGLGTIDTNPYKNFEMLNAVVRPQVGLSINAGLGGANGDTLIMHLRGDSLSNEEMLDLATKLEEVTLWITDKNNWDAPVGRFIEAIDAKASNIV